jgi:hypothetical protein
MRPLTLRCPRDLHKDHVVTPAIVIIGGSCPPSNNHDTKGVPACQIFALFIAVPIPRSVSSWWGASLASASLFMSPVVVSY